MTASTINGETSTASTNGAAPIAVYLYAGDQIIENVTTGHFYYQDSLGNTSHVTDSVGNLLERYTYSAFGIPTFLSANNTQLSTSAYGIRHLFQGQLWTQDTGLNDYRNRVALPTMGVFLQPDPIGFKGDALNLYRFCTNNAVNRIDPDGLLDTTWSRLMLWQGGGDGTVSEQLERLQLAGRNDGGFSMGQMSASERQTQRAAIEEAGELRIDTDGTGDSHGNQHHQSHTSAMIDADGRFVPRRTDQIGRNGNRDLNADVDRYAVAPQTMAVSQGGPLRVGDRATISLPNGRHATARIGDFGPAGRHGEVSVAVARSLGYRPLYVPAIRSIVPSPDGRTSPTVPVLVRYYPDTYTDQ
jgi:RHS repeat-associated protein